MSDQQAMLALLDGLLVGAEQLVESVDEWAERLGGDNPSPLVSRFVDELDMEWLDATPPNAICERLAAQARERISTWHPGWPHAWAHLLRVTGTAVAMAKDEGLNPVSAFIAGMCHDIAKLDEFRTGEPHEEAGARFAATVLAGHLPPDQIISIEAAIRHQGEEPLCYILYDADQLDKIGAAGILRRVSNVKHQTALPTTLWRVMDDAWLFPDMHFERSNSLFRRKRTFQVWFLPLAEQAIGEG
jgi:hypothetical protein